MLKIVRLLLLSGMTFMTCKPAYSSTGDDIRFLLGQAEKVRWDSRLHRHHLPNPEFQKRLDLMIELINQKPELYQDALMQLSPEERKEWTTDSLSTREDWVDILSVAIKERLQQLWASPLIDYPYARSNLWSLSKSRLRQIYGQQTFESTTGINIFRKSDPASTDFVLACAGAQPLQLSNTLSEGARLKFAGIVAQEYRWESDAKTSAEFECEGRKFVITRESLSGHARPVFRDDFFFTDSFRRAELRALASIGLTDRTDPWMLRGARWFMEYRAGFDLISEEQVAWRESLLKELARSEILVPLINMPDANSFDFSAKAESATRLVFRKRIDNAASASGHVDLIFTIFLPPTKTPEAQAQSVRLSQEELARQWSQLSAPPTVLDLACFSQKYQADWLAVILESRRLRNSRQDSESLPPIITSARGHPGENLAQVLFVLDQILDVLQKMASGARPAQVIERLSGPGQLASWMHRLQNPGAWMNNRLPPNPHLYSPVSSLDASLEPLSQWKEWSLIRVQESGKPDKMFTPRLIKEAL